MSEQDFEVSKHKVNKNLKMGQSKLYLCGGLPTDWLPHPTGMHDGKWDKVKEAEVTQGEVEISMKIHSSPRFQECQETDGNFKVRSPLLEQCDKARSRCDQLSIDSSDLGLDLAAHTTDQRPGRDLEEKVHSDIDVTLKGLRNRSERSSTQDYRENGGLTGNEQISPDFTSSDKHAEQYPSTMLLNEQQVQLKQLNRFDEILRSEQRPAGRQVEQNVSEEKVAITTGALDEDHSTSAFCMNDSVRKFTAEIPQAKAYCTFKHMACLTYPSRKVSGNHTDPRTHSQSAHAVRNKHASEKRTTASPNARQNVTINTTCVSSNMKDESSHVTQETSHCISVPNTQEEHCISVPNTQEERCTSILRTEEEAAQVYTLVQTASSCCPEHSGSISVTDTVTPQPDCVNEAVWTDPLEHAEREFLNQYTDMTSNKPYKPINRGEVTPEQHMTHKEPRGKISQVIDKGHITQEQNRMSSDSTNCIENRSSARTPTKDYLVNCMQALKDVAYQKELDLVDVHPDGNCLFTAIVDQLRVRGQFYYTPRSLREAAVQQLRTHPTQEDGTPLHEFLEGETWEEYLYRMSHEGQWADHVIISAIPKLLGCRLVILGGAAGTSFTVLEPDNRKQDPSSQRDAGKGDDKCITHNTSSQHIMEDDLVIGHIPEAHYLSLRRNDWMYRFSSTLHALDTPCYLREDTESLIGHREDSHDHSISAQGFPALHLNFLVKYIFRARLILILREQIKEFQDKYFSTHIIGDRYSGFATRFSGPYNPERVCCKWMYDSMMIMLVSDTHVVFDDSVSSRKDLLALDIHDQPGYLYLLPACPEIWRIALKDQDGQMYLKHLYPLGASVKIPGQEQPNSRINCLSFSCQWPLVCEEWMDRHRPGQWPSQDTREQIMNTVKVIPTDKATPGSEIVWMYCFGLAERILCHDLNPRVRKCHGLVSAMFQFALQGDIPIALYEILKSVFLYTCEEIDAQGFYQAPGYCIMRILNSLHSQLSERNVPDYFISDRNLVREIDEQEISHFISMTESLLKHMVGYMFGVFQQHSLPSSVSLQKIYDGLLADAQQFQQHNQQDISWTCFHRLYIIEAQENAKSSDYVTAYNTLRAFLQDSSAYTETSNTERLEDAMAKVLTGLPLQEQWILSFYVDQMQETTILEGVCNGRDCVSLKQLFGEQFVQVLTSLSLEYDRQTGSQNATNFEVPCEILYQENELCFVQQFGKILNCLQYDDAYLSATHFYLKTNTMKLLHAIVTDCQQWGHHSGHNTAISKLHNLYHDVLGTYRNHHQTQCFLDLMDNFDVLSSHINSVSNYNWLAEMWAYFGNTEKSNEAKARAMKLQNKSGHVEGCSYV